MEVQCRPWAPRTVRHTSILVDLTAVTPLSVDTLERRCRPDGFPVQGETTLRYSVLFRREGLPALYD